MSKYDFMKQVENKVREKLSASGYDVESSVFVKNNDTKAYGIVIKKDPDPVAPTIYVDNYYKSYLRKKITVKETAQKVIDVVDSLEDKKESFEGVDLSYEACAGRIIYRLVSKERNKQRLKNSPYVPFLNMAISFHILCDFNDSNVETIPITNTISNYWGVGTDKLMEHAKANTPIYFPAKTEHIEDILSSYLDIDIDGFMSGLLVVTNDSSVNGATCMLYDDLISDIADTYGSDLIIIPSSIHELLILPYESKDFYQAVADIVVDVNENHVRDDEILSDTPYYFDRKEKRFYFTK